MKSSIDISQIVTITFRNKNNENVTCDVPLDVRIYINVLRRAIADMANIGYKVLDVKKFPANPDTINKG